MERHVRGYELWTVWWAIATAATLVLAAAALALPRLVYDRFIWRYFWGPIVADGRGVRCVERVDGSTLLHGSITACQQASGVVAEPGYTTVSTVTYALVLLFALAGVYLGLERYGFGTEPSLFFAVLPFMFLGGTARVLEDAMIALPEGSGALVPTFPTTALLISPPIYFLMFAVTVVALAVGVRMESQGLVSTYAAPVAVIGTLLLLAALTYLAYLTSHIPDLSSSVPMLLITLVGASLLAGAIYWGAERFAPEINEGTGLMGIVVIWGHAIDGFANVLSLDWADALGLARSYQPKHVVNSLIIDVMEAVQEPWMTDAIGTAWPFLFLKVAIATLVVWLFDDELFETIPRFGLVLLIAVLAVGVGPGTRDLLRASIGI